MIRSLSQEQITEWTKTNWELTSSGKSPITLEAWCAANQPPAVSNAQLRRQAALKASLAKPS
jgi:hypothetical protein